MAVRELRRLAPIVRESLYDRMTAQTLHQATHRPLVDALEREHPELIIDDGTNVLASEGTGGAKLIYGFESAPAFVDRFPRMFEKLLPKIRRVYRADSVRLRVPRCGCALRFGPRSCWGWCSPRAAATRMRKVPQATQP